LKIRSADLDLKSTPAQAADTLCRQELAEDVSVVISPAWIFLGFCGGTRNLDLSKRFRRAAIHRMAPTSNTAQIATMMGSELESMN
jgi:hypothetical protein